MFIDWEKHTDYWLPSILKGHDALCPPALWLSELRGSENWCVLTSLKCHAGNTSPLAGAEVCYEDNPPLRQGMTR